MTFDSFFHAVSDTVVLLGACARLFVQLQLRFYVLGRICDTDFDTSGNTTCKMKNDPIRIEVDEKLYVPGLKMTFTQPEVEITN